MPRIKASSTNSPRPVVKWAGGKSKLADQLVGWMPAKIGTYVEPFCGGAAVFFRLASEPTARFERAILADKNEHLIALYTAIQTRVDELIESVSKLSRDHLARSPKQREEHFYAIRNAVPGADIVARATRILFLNKTCFNGLWRENASGKNNVPYGRYARPKIFDVDALLAANRALRNVKLKVADFESVTKKLKRGDFVYFDPPYVPVSKTANFTSYAKDGFGEKEQRRLRALLHDLHRRGVEAMLSNAHTPDTETFYADFEWRSVPMPRSINSDPSKRGDVKELVVFNHPPESVRKAAS